MPYPWSEQFRKQLTPTIIRGLSFILKLLECNQKRFPDGDPSTPKDMETKNEKQIHFPRLFKWYKQRSIWFSALREGSIQTQTNMVRREFYLLNYIQWSGTQRWSAQNIKLNSTVIPEIKEQLISIVKKYWDYFLKEGAKRTILGYKLSINTGNTKPVCCKKLQYRPYESKIIMEQVPELLKNIWKEKFEWPWGSSIILAAKTHQ